MSRRVLLIEDEPNIAEAIRYILTRDGWAVASHAEGGDAVEVIRREAPDVVVLDIMLPGRSGLAILEDLRADPELADLPVLVLSARGQGDARAVVEVVGAARFIAKPFANSDIVTALRQMAGA